MFDIVQTMEKIRNFKINEGDKMTTKINQLSKLFRKKRKLEEELSDT